MDGIGENTAVIGDWLPPSPSPRSLFSTILYETVSPNPSSEPSGGEFMLGFEEMRSQNKDDDKYGKPTSVSGDHLAETRASSEPKIISRSSLVERMAARAGFHAPKLNTGNIRSSDAPPNADAHSSRSMIPPGLSPRILLESPVFVSNSMVQPSPTTGRFPFITDSNIRSATLTSEAEKTTAGHFGDLIASFTFKPVVESGSFFHRGAPNKAIAASSIYHSSQATQVSGQSHLASQSVEPQKAHEESSNQVHLQEDFSRSSSEKDTGSTVVGSGERSADMANDGSVEHSPPVSEHRDMDGEQQDGGVTVDCDGGGSGSSGGASAEYGYNWRKYGQKQVKGSEYPRSYYKCTHPNCPVKKVERSQEGHITEIIYKGAHNHMKPLPCRRSAIGFLNQLGDIHLNVSDPGGSHIDLDQSTQRDPPASSKWRNENLEVTSALSVGTDSCNQSTMLQPQNGTHFEAGDVLDVSSTFSHDEDEDDPGTHGSVSTGYEGEGDESESKRRKIEPYTADMNGATRSIREPRVVVQTTSEVDILDDGYRWRKYGQKVVKGNPNPRSYYKCTHAGCTVRKHVERASHDLKSVITTYEGKHNHDVPAARNSSHFNTGASNDVTSKGAPAIQTHVSRLEPSQIHNSMPMFEAPASLREFGVPASAQLGPHSYTYGMSRNSLANLAMGGFGPSQGRLPVLSRPPYSEQHHQVNQIGFTFPGEPKVEPVTDSVLNLPDGLQLAYPQVTGGLPLVRQM